MGAHADILRSLLTELNRFDHKVEALIARQHECVAVTREHVDSAMQITKRDDRAKRRVPARNGAFLWD